MPADSCHLVDLPRFSDQRGNLAIAEVGQHVPFDIRRIYYLYGVPPAAERGAHGHRELEQLIIAMAGSVDIEVDDGHQRRTFRLDDPAKALYICPMIWRDLRRFSPDAVVVVLASLPYDENDYFRDYPSFLEAVANPCR
jgi:dTDP-4-dehydrorhamnose 3,5-epimerase-like enzyme